jgi:hypothetical protein
MRWLDSTPAPSNMQSVAAGRGMWRSRTPGWALQTGGDTRRCRLASPGRVQRYGCSALGGSASSPVMELGRRKLKVVENWVAGASSSGRPVEPLDSLDAPPCVILASCWGAARHWPASRAQRALGGLAAHPRPPIPATYNLARLPACIDDTYRC